MASIRKKNKSGQRRREERRIIIRGVRRNPPDVGKLSKALIGLAIAEAERQAQAQQPNCHATPEVTSGQRPTEGRA